MHPWNKSWISRILIACSGLCIWLFFFFPPRVFCKRGWDESSGSVVDTSRGGRRPAVPPCGTIPATLPGSTWAMLLHWARPEETCPWMQSQMFSLLVQDLQSKRKYSAITIYSPDTLRQGEWKAKLPLVLTAAQGPLDVVWEGNGRFFRVLQ